MSDITVVVVTSPIKSHPDTKIIKECLETVNYHLPDSEVIITFDGIHPKQTKFESAYKEYKTKMMRLCLENNYLPLLFDEHEHQSGMMHEALKYIKTPLIVYMEHDTMLTIDRKIDWQKCKDFIYAGEANTIRFHFEEVIPKEHENLIIGQTENGFIPTIQWSQRPLLTTRVYMEQVMNFFPKNAKTFIEDEWHGVVLNDYYKDGKLGWLKHRLYIYGVADTLGIKRSYTVDGRQGEPKVGEGFQC